MNLDDEIGVYGRWPGKLKAYLKKPDGSLKVADLRVDDKCALGHWIHEEEAKLAAMDEYAALKDLHARFHAAAADIVALADGGQTEPAEAALGKKDFRVLFGRLISALIQMKNKVP